MMGIPMTGRALRLIILLSFSMAAFPGISAAQALIHCEHEEVLYSAFDRWFAGRIRLTPQPTSYVPPQENERKFSPQRDRWLVQTRPDSTRPGPWTTTIVIGTSHHGKASKLSLIDHTSGGVRVQWLNEKLLFVQVWWGRIVSTDLVLDAEHRTFLYQERANYGAFTEPCE
jgi:hypothetical protein